MITISKGHDASYPWRQIGAAEPDTAARTAGSVAGYYLSPTEKGGEPPGIWTGRGVAELGLRPGGIVQRDVFERLYGHHLDPRDPSGQTRLGRAPGKYREADEIYAALLAAEPQATAERRAQLMIEAKARVRTPDLYWDATFSVSKSISLFHASALANAAAAAENGDPDAARDWEHVADGIWDAIMEGNAAALEYLQREAGQTRAGYHPGGRWEDAREWVIASFRQHTSRDGDPQLHVHNLILHKVRRETDGQWRALDSMSLYRHRPAASAIAALAAENALTRRYGVAWVPRRDGHGREIAGAGQALMDMFSSRRRSIGPVTARLAREYEAQFGRAPDARALASLRQWANHATRRGKDAEVLDLAALVRRWSAQARASEAGTLEPLARAVMDATAPAPAAAPGTAPGPAQAHAAPLTEAQAQRVIAEAVAAVQAAQSTWTEADLIRHLGERLPVGIAPVSPAQGRRAAARISPSGPRRECGHAGAAGMAARAGLPAPRLGRERVHPARRGPVRHRRAAHPRRPAACPRRRARRAAPCARRGGADARRGTGATRSATPGASCHPGSHPPAHGVRAAPGPGRRRIQRAHLCPARRGAGRASRIREDPHRRRDGTDLARCRNGRGNRPDDLSDRRATSWSMRASPRLTTPPGSSATWKAAAKPAGRCPSNRVRCSSWTRPA